MAWSARSATAGRVGSENVGPDPEEHRRVLLAVINTHVPLEREFAGGTFIWSKAAACTLAPPERRLAAPWGPKLGPTPRRRDPLKLRGHAGQRQLGASGSRTLPGHTPGPLPY
jgi:hypothetical protein